MNARQKQRTGFTIIEVVLVLAIAALIFLMVFIALPALQRNQRDTDRKTAMSTVSSAVQTYISNNRGQLVGASSSAIAKYADPNAVGSQINNGIYTVSVAAAASNTNNTTILVITTARCKTSNIDTTTAAGVANIGTGTGATARNAAIVMKMETGDAYSCQDI